MKYVIVISKRYFKIFLAILILSAFVITAVLLKDSGAFVFAGSNEEVQMLLENFFDDRCSALLTSDISIIRGQFDLSSRYGQWAYEHEVKRIKFVKDWSMSRDTKFIDCETKLKISSIRGSGNNFRIYLNDMTRMGYVYNSQEATMINEFSFGTWHTISLVKKADTWFITTDWYSDPLDDTMPSTEQSDSYYDADIETSAGVWLKYDRAKAVEYADKYCGANFNITDGYKYNKKYKSYAALGGDCANFISQVLSDKDGGGIRAGGGWLYKSGEASASWVNAGKFTYSLLYSGRAKLVSKGKYAKVVSSIKNILPGDIISYQKKGDIVHVSIVTAIDSMGVPLVNSHTNDRYHVPWDFGWNSESVTFLLLKING